MSGTKEIKIFGGEIALIDGEDYERISNYRWYLDKDGYAITTRPTRRMHRLIMNAEPGTMLDHINGEKRDNRKANLRFCTAQQNTINRKKLSRGTSGFIGVNFLKPRTSYKKWRAVICGELIGYFETPIEAAKVRDIEAFKRFGKFAVLNFPESIHD